MLRQLALETVGLVMDGRGVGRGCSALMIHVVYKGRALPLAWRVRHTPKGHFPEALHITVVELRREVSPHLRQDKLYIKENEGILPEVKLFPCAYRRNLSCSCP